MPSFHKVRRINLTQPLVNEWWKQRQLAGCQLAHLSHFLEGWDYAGKGLWFRWVALAALNFDFMLWSKKSITTGQFSKMFRTAGGFVKIDDRTASLRRPDGSLYVRTQRSAAIFAPKPVLDTDLAGVLDSLVEGQEPEAGTINNTGD